MWNPRRVTITIIMLAAFFGLYVGYQRVLGKFNGLPPLPEQFLPHDGPVPPSPPPTGNSMIRKFELAFGSDCPELHYPFKVELEGKKSLIAFNDFKFIKDGPRDGWVELTPLSIANFTDTRGPDGTPEINTFHVDVAYVRFDRPIKALSDISGSKIVMAEMHADPDAPYSDIRKGRVHGRNNRHSLDLNDDIEMVTPGPMYYEATPRKGQPHIYSFTQVQIFDHQNTGLPVPDHKAPREPTASGVGLRIFMTAAPPPPAKDKGPAKAPEKKPEAAKKAKPGLSGVDLIELDHNVEMNLWTDASTSLVAGGNAPPKEAKPRQKDDAGKPTAPLEKRLLTVKTNGPFRYDAVRDIAHFEKPAVEQPGLIERVTVTRTSKTAGRELIDCDYLDVAFQPRPPADPKKAKPDQARDPKASGGESNLQLKSVRAWGEAVVITSDADNLRAIGAEMTHDADTRTTVLRGDGREKISVQKGTTLIQGSELHLFGAGGEISQAHVLGAGWAGLGDLDPKTRTYMKQAFWTDRLVYSKIVEKDRPPVELLTLLGNETGGASFKEIDKDGKPRDIDAQQIKVWLAPKESAKGKDGKPLPKQYDPKVVEVKKGPGKGETAKKADPPKDPLGSARPTRMEATGNVRANSPDIIVRKADYLDVVFQDVPKLIKDPKKNSNNPLDTRGRATVEAGPAPRTVDPAAPKGKLPPPGKAVVEGKEPAKKEPVREKKPSIVTAKRLNVFVNRDPDGRTEVDQVQARGDVDVHQDPATKDELGTDVAGDRVDMKVYAEGNLLTVFGLPAHAAMPKPVWGRVHSDKLDLWGMDIAIDQRTNTARVIGEGSMDILSATDMEGKKLEAPRSMKVWWRHRMDFWGTDKLINFHGTVLAVQADSSVKSEWMQVLLDRPVYLNQAMRPTPPKSAKPGEKRESDNPKIDTISTDHMPRDEDLPRPRVPVPVTIIEQVKEGDRVIKFTSIQAPEVMTVVTPVEKGKSKHVMQAPSSDVMPGLVRLWQPGAKDVGAEPKADAKKADPKAKEPVRKKGELGPDEEMKLTVVQYGTKMIAEDFRKRAKFFGHTRVVHLAADRPDLAVDLREGEIPKGAFYLECRDWLDVYTTPRKERDKDGKEIDKNYQEMVAKGNVRVRKQGEFFGEADLVTYSEEKGTIVFHGTDRNPATVTQIRGQGVPQRPQSGRTIIYYVKTKTFEVKNATGVSN